MRSAKTIDYVNLDRGRASISGPTPKRLLGRPQPIDGLKVLPRYRNLAERGGTPPPPPATTPPAFGPIYVTPSGAPELGPYNVSTESNNTPASGPSNVTLSTSEGFVITIRQLKTDILARTGDPIGTIAFATDTKDLYVYNTTGFDKWSSYEDSQ